MNIVFFGSSSFVSQKLVENLSKKKNTIFFSRSKKYSITSNNFDLTNKLVKKANRSFSSLKTQETGIFSSILIYYTYLFWA